MADSNSEPQPEPTGESESQPDRRLYLKTPDGWEARVKQGWEKEYCYQKSENEDYFHLILNGEIYLAHGNEKYCLNCAFQNGVLTTDRLAWQHGVNNTQPPSL